MKNQLENLRTFTTTRQTQQKNIFTAIGSRELTENILLFLLSRIVFMDYLISPFGIALFSALFYRKKRISYMMFSVFGVLSTGLPLFFFKYIGSLLIICAVQLIFKKELEHKKRLVALLGMAAVFANGAIYVIFEGFFAFDTLLLILECTLTLGAFFVFDKSIILTRYHIRRNSFELYELISIVLLMASGIMSLALSENFEPIAHVAAIFIILFVALTYGAAPCVPTGAIFGLALGVGNTFPAQLVCIYSLSSLFCGLFDRYGRLAVSGAFAAASFLSTLLLCPETSGILTVSYVAAACLILFFVPDSTLASFASAAKKPRKEAALTTKITDAFNEKFSEITTAVQSVSNIFYEIVDSLSDPSYESTSAVFEATADTVCADCSLCRFCWHKDKKTTLDAIEHMCSAIENKSAFSVKDIPKEFSDICIRSEVYASELAKNLEAFKVSKMWSGKLMESKRLVAEQFENISMILNDTQKSVAKKISFLPEAERRITAELERLGICSEKICVYAHDGFFVEIKKPSCESKTECDVLIPSVLSEILETPMVKMPADCGKATCSVSFCEKPQFTTDIATASAVKKNSAGSGDSLCCFSPDAGKIAIILCDGMGSGEHANYQSNIAAELCKKLLCAGFTPKTCIRLVNDILMTGADRDSFSTVDMCVINLYTAQTEFIKAGAPNSYIRQGDKHLSIEASSLPAGMINSIEPDVSTKTFSQGDYIILATDGITDALDISDEDEMRILCDDLHISSQELADKILNRALELSGNHPTDDMTVTVCKIDK